MKINPAWAIFAVFLLALVLDGERIVYSALANLAMLDFTGSGYLQGEASPTTLQSAKNLLGLAQPWKGQHTPEKLRAKGLIALRSNEVEQAIADLEKASMGGNFLANYDLARWHLARRDWPAAAQELAKADGSQGVLINRWMDKLSEAGDPAGAIALGSAYTHLQSNSPRVYYRLVNLYWAAGDRQNTILALDQAMRFDPDIASSNYQYNYARLEYLRGNYPQAATRLEAILAAQPADFAAQVLAGQVYLAMEQPAQAEKVLLAALETHELHYWSHIYLAAAYRGQGKLDLAAQEYRRASQLIPDPAASLELLADTYAKMGVTCLESQSRMLAQQAGRGENLNLDQAFERMDVACEQ